MFMDSIITNAIFNLIYTSTKKRRGDLPRVERSGGKNRREGDNGMSYEFRASKKASATGFEPVRVTPTDFESVSLTTRTY